MAYTGPFPHNNTGFVSAIIVSGTSFSGNVGNTGNIAPGGTSGTGIRVENDSTINGAISNAGTIAVLGDGIMVAGTSSAHDNSNVIKGIVNAGSGTITASANGILVQYETKFAGGISNAGTISADFAGIWVDDVSTFAGGISNAGTISADVVGIYVFDASTVAGGIGNTGTINGAYGIAVLADTTFTGNITNSGTITATSGYGIWASDIDVSGAATFSGNIANSGVIIASAYGLAIENAGASRFSGNISNSGRITATTGDGFYLFKLAADGNFTGNISNSGAVTSTAGYGIDIENVANAPAGTFAGTIANSGAISAQKTGLDIDNVGTSRFSGNISNSGAINSTTGLGIFIQDVADDGTFAGNIGNSGAISAVEAGLAIESVGTSAFSGNISNSGAISAVDTGLAIGGVGTSAFSGTIANSGAITSTAGDGIEIEDVATDGKFAHSIANTAKILAQKTGLAIADVGTSGFSGGISNSGAVTSTAGYGIDIENVASAPAGTFAGTIANSGAISAQKTGLDIDNVGTSRFSGNISNSGAINSTTGLGIFIQDVADDGTFAGNIGNSGAISAVEAGLAIESVGTSAFSGNISNSGAISAVDDGLVIGGVGTSAFSGTIANSGAITATAGDGIEIEDVATDGKFAHSIANTAKILAQKTGLAIADVGTSGFSGGISNSGAVTSTAGYGIDIENVANAPAGTFAGTIANSGAISAQKTGLDIDNVGTSRFSGNISNSGAINSTTGLGIFIQDVADDGTFAGNIGNSGAISAVEAGLAIESVGTSAFSGNISNSGAISAVDTGLAIGGVGTSAFSGTIANSGAITSTAGDGIEIEDVATDGKFAHSIANTAKILAQKTGLAIADVGTSGFSGGISNSGAVTSTAGYGIDIENVANAPAGTFAGTIANSGAISAQKTGLDIDNVGTSRFSGNISNSGAINSTTGLGIFIQDVADDGTFAGNIGNSGAISAVEAGLAIESVGTSAFSGNISNSGAISAVDDGLVIGGVGTSAFSGTIANSGAITSTAGDGIEIEDVATDGKFAGNISNSGKIVSTNGLGIYVDNVATNGTFSGSIINTGAITAYDTGMSVANVGHPFSGGITNSGSISTKINDGLLVGNVASMTGNIVNAATGTIAAPTGIHIVDSTITGAIIDSGAIVATDEGILIDDTSKIIAAKTAIDITGSTLIGGVYNAGVISGEIGIEVAGAHGVNVFDDGSITGSGGTAVLFKTGGDDFTLGAGYSVTGEVVGSAGDALQLGGVAAASFNLNAIGSQYRGFGTFNVVGGTWTVSGTGGDWNVDSGGEMIISTGAVLSNTTVHVGGDVSILAGGVLETTSGEIAIIAGDVTNAGTLLASGANSLLEITDAATVTGGGLVEIDNGNVRIQGAGSENVTFLTGGSGGLQIADTHSNETEYSGTISGFGAPSHTNTTQYIDLTSVTYSAGQIARSFTGGVLTVTSGGTAVAEINFAGSYSTVDFALTSGAGDTVEITDPTVVGGGVQSANIALLGNYMASMFVTSAFNGGMPTSDTRTPQQTLLTHPHA